MISTSAELQGVNCDSRHCYFWPILVCHVPLVSQVLRQIQCHIHYWHRLLVWYLWSPRSMVPDHVACCIASSIDMSGLPVYGCGLLPWLLDLTSFYLSKLYVRWSLSLFWDSYFPLHRIHFVGCVTSLHFSVHLLICVPTWFGLRECLGCFYCME